MLYEIEVIKAEEGKAEEYRLWISQDRKRDCIIYFDLYEKPVVEIDTLIVRTGTKIKEGETLFFALKYGDIVEVKKE